MSTETNLVPVDLTQLPSTQLGSDDQFMELAKSTEFIGRLQLFTKGKAINKGLVPPGSYGIPESDEEVQDLTSEINIIPLARRPKAIDMTDTDAVLVNYDPDSGRVQADRRHVAGKGIALHVRPILPRDRGIERSLPGVLLRQQVHPQRSQENLSLPAPDGDGHRAPEGGRQ